MLKANRRDQVARGFGVALKAARKARGLKQHELARLSGVDPSFPSILERGLQSPNLIYILALAEGLKMDPVELIAAAVRELKKSV